MRTAATAMVMLALISLAPRSAVARAVEFVFRENTLPPIAHTIFCNNYPHECSRSKASSSFLTSNPRLLYAELDLVNRQVNAAIRPEAAKARGAFGNIWLLFPSAGNCNDYVVSKRHELMARGWPSSALLLAEVALSSGEHHLVLVVDAGHETYVLDNLKPNIVRLSNAADYRWIRIESPQVPKNWARMGLHN